MHITFKYTLIKNFPLNTRLYVYNSITKYFQ